MAEKKWQSGDFNRKVVFMKPTEIRTGSGASKPTYEDLPATWAHRKDELGGISENSPANRITALSLVTFTIRYRADVTVEWQLKSDGDTFDIQHIAPIGRKMYLALRCQRHD